jgi:hypothetical protein
LLSPLLVLIAVLCCAAKPPAPATVVPLGHNTFSITREAATGFTRDTDPLKAQVQQDAAQYCAAQGKQLIVVSLTDDKPWFSVGFVSAKIVFKALTADEITVSKAAAATEAVERPSTTGDLYTDLLKLDELRKKGILTKAEFNAEKQKVLDRSR